MRPTIAFEGTAQQANVAVEASDAGRGRCPLDSDSVIRVRIRALAAHRADWSPIER